MRLNRFNPLRLPCRWQPLGAALVALFCATTHAQSDGKPPAYKDTSLDFETRAKDLVAHMTLEEKVPQLINDAPAIPRLGVREFNWWNEGLHGVAGLDEATVFPQAVGMAATWDETLMQQIADIISVEFRAKHIENQHRFGGSDWFGGLTVWSPNINIFRDPRWGRGQETYGEDPHLTGRLGVAFVKGLQGRDDKYLRTVATPKHYAVHSGPEATRHQDDIHPTRKDLEETYLPAFRDTVVEANAQSIMCAYNAVDGVPACASEALMTQTLRKDWGFKGYVVSDCGAVLDIYTESHHGYTDSSALGVTKAFNAGMDLICGNADEANHIHEALNQGLLTEDDIDASLVRLFTARMRLGQFDPRPKVFPRITSKDYDTPEHRQFNLQVAEKSLVLLKNQGGILPLAPSVKSIAVIGPNADSVDTLVGNYNGTPSAPVTVIDGIRKRFKPLRVSFEPGVGLLDPVQSPVPDAQLCQDAKCRKPGLKVEHFAEQGLTGKPVAAEVVANASVQWAGEVRATSKRWSGYIKAPETGTYTFRYKANGGYRIWVNDTLVIDAWHVDWRPVIASGSIELAAGKRYPIKVEAFQRGDEGDEFLAWSLPSDPGAAKAVAAAKAADVVVYVAGLTSQTEGEEMPVDIPGFSGGDRTRISLPEVQEALLERLLATGKPVVLVLMNGSALAVNVADAKAAAIVEAWYPGGEGGQAVANLLAGDFSPAGRLPVTFYRSVEQLPPFKDYRLANRTYRYFTGEPLYPFGYGLSYTAFEYSDVKISPKKWSGKGTVKVSVKVTNTGAMTGDEVVQLYASHLDVKNTPIRSLVGFKRLNIPKGATKTVTFELNARRLSTVDENGVRALVPGMVKLWVGGGQPKQRKGLVPAPGLEAGLIIKRGSSLPR